MPIPGLTPRDSEFVSSGQSHLKSVGGPGIPTVVASPHLIRNILKAIVSHTEYK